MSNQVLSNIRQPRTGSHLVHLPMYPQTAQRPVGSPVVENPEQIETDGRMAAAVYLLLSALLTPATVGVCLWVLMR